MAGDFEEALARVASGQSSREQVRLLREGGTAALEAAATHLERHELPIDAVERVEGAVKETIAQVLSRPATTTTAAQLALAMKRIGFFHKLKSYAVKAASPLGYSVFFQRPGEGFSFQRHVTHKIELFHIVSAPPGGYAFICDHEAWERVYEPKRFQRWLDGTPDPAYDRFRHLPTPGDVIVIDRLNVVHTVIGCALEEFATISTDMVDRLHDQNVGKPIPPDFSRSRVNTLLATLPDVEPRRILEVGAEGLVGRPPHVEEYTWGELRAVTIGPLTARHLVLHPGGATDPHSGELDASSVFVRAGRGRLVLGSDREALTEIDLDSGALTLVPAGVPFRLVADGGSTLRVSEQRLPLRTAFGP